MSNSYEELRDQATGDGADAWRAADKEQANLRAFYVSLKEDPRYAAEHKAEQAWAKYDAVKDKIISNREKAKTLLEKRARSTERSSLPFPDGESPVTSDASRLIASQNEASRLVRQIDRAAASTKKGPFTVDPRGVLREEYARGLEVGGVSGGAICRGVLAAVDELGYDKHAIVEASRKPHHREAFERAEHSERLKGLIGGAVPEPPFERPGQRKKGRPGERRPATFLLPPTSTLEEPASSRSKRRPSWK